MKSMTSVSDPTQPEEMPKRRSRIGRLFVTAVLAFGLLALLATVYSRRQRGLFDNAKRVPGYHITGNNYSIRWGWTSETELVYENMTRSPARMEHLDLRTGASYRTPLIDLQHLPGSRPILARRLVSISPDGASVIANTRYRNERTQQDEVVSLKTGAIREIPGARPFSLIWSADGKSVAGTTQNGFLVARAPDFRPEEFPVSSAPAVRIYWFDGRDRMGLLRYGPANALSPQLFEVRLGHPCTIRQIPLHFPDGGRITSAELSPTGDRIAWWVEWLQERPSWMDRVMRLLKRQPVVPSNQALTEGVLISKPDGSEMRELGSVKAVFAPDGMGAVKWMPDGKRLCVLYKRGLYLVPVD